MQLTIYYDGYCPLCVAEMDRLAELDENNLLAFEDIHSDDFGERNPHIDPLAADKYLHAQYADGIMIYGLDVTHQAWSMVNQNRWLAVLRWPIIRWFANFAYRIFARYRYSISFLLTGKRRCIPCRKNGTKNLANCDLSDNT